ncbi:MAG: ABC transporter permease subunit [Planctomycetes bacterium]|nr:ABC transporter permease subunit [Planctomycetota bacterium]
MIEQLSQSWLIARREAHSFLVSPFSYAIAGLFLLVNGIFFFLFVNELRGDFDEVVALFFSFWNFWLLALFIPPLLTMRLVADEFRLGTIEMLMSAPASDAAVITGKYLASMFFTALLWAPTLLFFAIANLFGASFDWGIVLSGYLGAMLVYGLFNAIGVMVSALAVEPAMSAFSAIVIELILFFFMLLPYWVQTDWVKSVSNRYSIYQIMSEWLLKGVVDSAHLLFLASSIWILLFLATRSLELRRWR